MKAIQLLLLSSCFIITLNAQTNIEGIINVYSKVTNVDKCTSQIEVENPTNFTEGMMVLLIQMQGAVIKEDDETTFGELIDIGQAGVFEKGEIAQISGNTIYLKYVLVNDYDATGTVQLVSLPQYENATIVDELVAKPWDGNTGGVIAFEVANELTMEANINVNGLGFRGGRGSNPENNPCSSGTKADAYYYKSGNWKGSNKGEGIARFLIEKEAGRGAQANGGGGGNDHKTGGGGGASAGHGGHGGENKEPGFFLCNGKFPGKAGRKIEYSKSDRLFLGGGGGAGHYFNSSGAEAPVVGVPGGNGGGIVLLTATTIVTNGHSVLANGQNTGDSSSSGGGGGGAGGTIAIKADAIQGLLTVSATGADGVSANNNNQERCFGPGGGGSGGYILLDASQNINIQVDGGKAGVSKNSKSCNESSQGAGDGEMGDQGIFSAIPFGTNLGGEIGFAQRPIDTEGCLGEGNVEFVIIPQGADISIEWQVDKGLGYETITDNATYEGSDSTVLVVKNPSESMQDYKYICVISSACGQEIPSEPVQFDLTIRPSLDFTLRTISGRLIQLESNIEGEISELSWDFGDGTSSKEVNPRHLYAGDGVYNVVLSVTNGCGTFTKTESIAVNVPPFAQFQADKQMGCAPLVIQYESVADGTIEDLEWQFPGGSPASSNALQPHVTYTEGGSYDVILIATNAAGRDTAIFRNFVTVDGGPKADFFVTVEDLAVEFNNTTLDADSYQWFFGDGQNSSQTAPIYTYNLEGEYEVALHATNECGTTIYKEIITTGALPVASYSISKGTGCAPLEVNFMDESTGTNISSSWEWSFPGGNPATSKEANPVVTYDSAGIYSATLTVSNNLGKSTKMEERLIKVIDEPIADFEFEQEDLTVQFINKSDGATNYLWRFGDQMQSRETNPLHTYGVSGTYTVILNANNAQCGNGVSKDILIVDTDIEAIAAITRLNFSPNPTKGALTLELESTNQFQSLSLHLTNLHGQLIQSYTLPNQQQQTFSLDISNLPEGIYLTTLQSDKWVVTERIVKE